MGYGTGAIMAVPAEDERDWDFATKFELDIIRTVQPADGHDMNTAYTGDGPSINSANDEISLNGLGKDEAKAAMIAWLEAKGIGEGAITYKLRDWLFSRQRYWGCLLYTSVLLSGVPGHVVTDEMVAAHRDE